MNRCTEAGEYSTRGSEQRMLLFDAVGAWVALQQGRNVVKQSVSVYSLSAFSVRTYSG